MSERLEIIKFLRNSEKTVAPGMQPSELISRKDVDWLIKQAEKREYWMKQHRKRANELEDAYFKIQLIEKQLQQAQAKAERYKHALEFYADENNYREHDLKGIVPPRPIAYKPILHDYGSIARQALESEK